MCCLESMVILMKKVDFMKRDLLTMNELSARTGLSRRTIQHLIDSGHIKKVIVLNKQGWGIYSYQQTMDAILRKKVN